MVLAHLSQLMGKEMGKHDRAEVRWPTALASLSSSFVPRAAELTSLLRIMQVRWLVLPLTRPGPGVGLLSL